MELEIDSISKSFGDLQVLNQISFTASSGMAMGLLGRNGAGKTTAIRIIMHVFPPDAGQIRLDGKPLRNGLASIGYLPEEKGLYPKFKIGDQLVYLGQLRGLSRKAAARSVNYWLERFSLAWYHDKKLETLSKGNQQKIQLALALLADPEIVILDEPFSGLDPVNAQLLKDIVREQVDAGKVVLFSSHQMSYVEQFCDNVALLDRGQIVLRGNLKQIKREKAKNRLYVQLSGDPAASGQRLSSLLSQHNRLAETVESIEASGDGSLIHLSDTGSRAHILSLLAGSGADVEQFRLAEPSLEEIFVEEVGESNEKQTV